MFDLAIMNGELYIEGNYVNSNIYISDGKISKISKQVLRSKDEYNAIGKKIFPGFIDPHVHFELKGGKYTSSDDFYSGSVSAAYGGITTFIDFLDPISTSAELEKAYLKRRKLSKKSVIDYAFHGTVKNPKNQVEQIVNELKKLHFSSVKLFTTYSESNRRTYDEEIIKLLKFSKEKQFIVLAHIENNDLINMNSKQKICDLPIARSSKAETSEAKKLAHYTRKYDGSMYMVHVSSGNTVKALKEDFSDIINSDFYIESCPHYFTYNNDIYNKEDGILYSMVPPLRSKEEVTLLKELIDNVNTIGTDHCPFTSKEKQKEKLLDIPMGIGGVEHSFNIMYSLFKEKIIDKMTINPAKIFNLYPRKGILSEGSDADIVIYDPLKNHTITNDHSLSDYTVYKGQSVSGQIESTIVRGNFIVKKGIFIGGTGEYLRDSR